MKQGRRIILEILMWMLIYLFFVFIFRNQHFWTRQLIAAESTTWLYFIVAINTRLFVPRFLLNGKRIQYVFFLFVLSFASFYLARKFVLTEMNGGYLYQFIESPDPSLSSRRGIHMTVLQLASIASLLGSTIVMVYRHNRETQERMAQVALEKKDTELKLLRTQFNPHFLLNTLNNLYSVSIIRPEQSSIHIERLMSLMKYLTYEQTDAKIELAKELEFIDDYIFFQTEKESERFDVIKEISLKDPECKIEPRILIPFVENAFKHSYHPSQVARIEIHFIQKDKNLHFSILNTKSHFSRSSKEEGYFGMGIDATLQLLNATYGEHHTITIDDQENSYSVEITFQNFFEHA